MEEQAYVEGEIAYRNGLELNQNPYGKNTTFFSDWEKGWWNAWGEETSTDESIINGF